MITTDKKVVNFTTLCENMNLKQIKKALKFYNKSFKPEKVLKYFKNWELIHDDSKYKNEIFLINYHSTGKWKTKLTINNNFEYTFEDNLNCWNYVPKTMSEFISDMLRYQDIDLIFSEKEFKKVHGKKNKII
jgi:hypothetical protein